MDEVKESHVWCYAIIFGLLAVSLFSYFILNDKNNTISQYEKSYVSWDKAYSNINSQFDSCKSNLSNYKMVYGSLSACEGIDKSDYYNVAFFVSQKQNFTIDHKNYSFGCKYCDYMMPYIEKLSYCFNFQYVELSKQNITDWDAWSKNRIAEYDLNNLPAFVCNLNETDFVKKEGFLFEDELKEWIITNCKKKYGLL